MRTIRTQTFALLGGILFAAAAHAAGPGTYLGAQLAPPGGNTTAQTLGSTGAGALSSNQPAASANNRALDTANNQFTDRQFGIERGQQNLTLEQAERQRAANQLELRARLGGNAADAVPPDAPPPTISSNPTAPISPLEPSGSTVTR